VRRCKPDPIAAIAPATPLDSTSLGLHRVLGEALARHCQLNSLRFLIQQLRAYPGWEVG
jgi:hypothetical protein